MEDEKRISLANWIFRKRNNMKKVLPTPELKPLAASSSEVLLAVLESNSDIKVEFRPDNSGLHICVIPAPEIRHTCSFKSLCILDDKSSPRHIQLDENGYVCASWDAIPEKVYVGLTDSTGELLGMLIPVDSSL